MPILFLNIKYTKREANFRTEVTLGKSLVSLPRFTRSYKKQIYGPRPCRTSAQIASLRWKLRIPAAVIRKFQCEQLRIENLIQAFSINLGYIFKIIIICYNRKNTGINAYCNVYCISWFQLLIFFH